MVAENPSAFPYPDVRDQDGCGIMEGSQGMTLRDWFAGQALPAVIAATAAGQHHPKHLADNPIEVAMSMDAYRIADAMLATRSGSAS